MHQLETNRDRKETDICRTEHFSDVLNRPPPTSEADVQEAEHDMNVHKMHHLRRNRSSQLSKQVP